MQLKNMKTAATFARRLLELGPKPEVANQVSNTSLYYFYMCLLNVTKIQYNEDVISTALCFFSSQDSQDPSSL